MKLCDKNDCLSCCACFAVCPKGAISMLADGIGKLVPTVDEQKCINCGLCEKACPQLQTVVKKCPLSCYAGYTEDCDDIKKCASGGFATTFARQTLLKNGIVYGAMYKDRQFSFVECRDEKAIELLRGSKYVYSYPGKIYLEIKKALTKGIQCTFIGLPCQVAGLNSFLGEKYENLLTVDLICHGAPPFSYLEEHIQDLGYADEYAYVSFRGEKNFYFTLRNKNGKELYSKKQQEDEYFEAFMSGMIHRECCYECPFACSERVSDITIGDFWGLAQDALNGYKGRISCALINTEKGKNFFSESSGSLVIEERDVTEAMAGNDQLRSPSKRHSARKIFEEAYKSQGFSHAMRESGINKRVKKLTIKNRVFWLSRKAKMLIRAVLGK